MKLLILLLSLFIFLSSLNASEKEQQIKGVVLERISQFIEYTDVGDEFKICVYGDESLLKIFKKIYKNREYKGIPIKIVQVNSVDEIEPCSILYAKKLSKAKMKEILAKTYSQTLLVTEEVSYIFDGFMVALYFENKKIKFVINQTAITKANMKVNYRLLKVASKVINPLKQ